MAAPPPSSLDGNQVLQHAFDEANGRLRTDATLVGSDVTVEVELDAANDSVRVEDPDTGAHFKVETDGSVNVNTVIDAADGDNISISDGTDTMAVNADGSINVDQVGIWDINLPTNAATETKQDIGNASLSSIDTKLDALQSPLTASTSTVTSVNVPTSSTQLLAANTDRKGAYFYNDGGGEIFLKLGTAASNSSYTVRMANNTFYELPIPIYTGIIHAIAGSGTRSVRITELT